MKAPRAQGIQGTSNMTSLRERRRKSGNLYRFGLDGLSTNARRTAAISWGLRRA